MKKRKVKKICSSYIFSLRHATKHTRREFAKIDAENQALDQMNLFGDEVIPSSPDTVSHKPSRPV
jgi:hypothetical protein